MRLSRTNMPLASPDPGERQPPKHHPSNNLAPHNREAIRDPEHSRRSQPTNPSELSKSGLGSEGLQALSNCGASLAIIRNPDDRGRSKPSPATPLPPRGLLQRLS